VDLTSSFEQVEEGGSTTSQSSASPRKRGGQVQEVAETAPPVELAQNIPTIAGTLKDAWLSYLSLIHPAHQVHQAIYILPLQCPVSVHPSL
jgi:hypothetical protein